MRLVGKGGCSFRLPASNSRNAGIISIRTSGPTGVNCNRRPFGLAMAGGDLNTRKTRVAFSPASPCIVRIMNFRVGNRRVACSMICGNSRAGRSFVPTRLFRPNSRLCGLTNFHSGRFKRRCSD